MMVIITGMTIMMIRCSIIIKAEMCTKPTSVVPAGCLPTVRQNLKDLGDEQKELIYKPQSQRRMVPTCLVERQGRLHRTEHW